MCICACVHVCMCACVCAYCMCPCVHVCVFSEEHKDNINRCFYIKRILRTVWRFLKRSTAIHVPLTKRCSSSIREGRILQLNVHVEEGFTWSGEGGRQYLPSQPHQSNQLKTKYWRGRWHQEPETNCHISKNTHRMVTPKFLTVTLKFYMQITLFWDPQKAELFIAQALPLHGVS